MANIEKCGLLVGRIERDFECYWPDKHADHNHYPQLVVADCSKLRTVCQFVKERILRLVEQEALDGTEDNLQFVVIGPEAGYHVEAVEKCLNAELDTTRFEIEHSRKKDRITIEDGYRILGGEHNSNLGWRIVLNCDPLNRMPRIIRKAFQTGAPFEELLPADYVAKHLKAIPEKPKDKHEEITEPGTRIRINLRTSTVRKDCQRCTRLSSA